MKTIRMFVPSRKGRSILHLRDASITPNSVIYVSATEASALGPATIDGSQNFSGFIGDASISVQNVSPGRGVVDFVVFVAFDRPLNVVVDIAVLDDKPDAIVIGT